MNAHERALEKHTRKSRRQTTNLSSLRLSSTSCCAPRIFNTTQRTPKQNAIFHTILLRVLSFICTNRSCSTFIIISFHILSRITYSFANKMHIFVHSSLRWWRHLTHMLMLNWMLFYFGAASRFICAMVDLNSIIILCGKGIQSILYSERGIMINSHPYYIAYLQKDSPYMWCFRNREGCLPKTLSKEKHSELPVQILRIKLCSFHLFCSRSQDEKYMAHE